MLEILALLAAAVVAVVISTRLGLGSVLGYIAAGALIGPSGFALVTDPENLRHLGEFGVVFLLFMIGLELKPKRLWIMRHLVFGLGGVQVLLCGVLFAVIANTVFSHDWHAAIAIGFGFALSSTAFCMQLLSESNEISTQHGRASFSILLFQDLAVVPIMIVLPLLVMGGGVPSANLTYDVALGAAIVVGALAAGRYAIGPVLQIVARIGNVDTFVAFALLFVLGYAWCMEAAGLSLAMGAFMAGMLLANSEFRHQIEADILPFRGLLLGLFFMSVGMSLDTRAIVDQSAAIALGTVGLLTTKAVIIIALCRVWRLSWRVAIRSGFILSQAGEFGFVIFSLADGLDIIDNATLDVLIAVTVISMAVTPFMQRLGNRLAGRLDDTPSDLSPVAVDHVRPVVIAGFGRVGETIAGMLKLADVPYVAIDSDAEVVADGRRRGFHVYYGSAAKPEVLRSVGAAQASLLVVTLDDASVAEALVRSTRRMFPALPIHIRVHDWQAADLFKEMGVEHAMPETVESSLRLGASALEAVGIDPEQRKKLFDDLSAEDFAKMRGLGD